MKAFRAIAIGLVSLVMIVGADQIRAQSGPQDNVLRRVVTHGTEAMVGWYGEWNQFNGTCTTRGYLTLTLTAPPQHGTVRFGTASVVPPPHSGCSNAIYATGVFYRPNPGFVGGDRFTFEIEQDPMMMNRFGSKSPTRIVIVTVN